MTNGVSLEKLYKIFDADWYSQKTETEIRYKNREEEMKVISFLTDFSVVDCIIDYPKVTFVAEKPPPSHVFERVALAVTERNMDYS